MMNPPSGYPKEVYIIFPYDSDGKIAGAYVGVTCLGVNRRIRLHINTHRDCGRQTELHDLMRNNGYTCIVVDQINSWKESSIEYDWIDYCEKKMNLHMFNNLKGLCNADWHRLKVVKTNV